VETVLEENALAGDSGYLDVPVIAVSPDHRYCAALWDATGDERHGLSVVEIASGRMRHLADDLAGSGLAWYADGRHLAAVRLDGANRPHLALRWRADRPDLPPQPLLEEADPAFRLTLAATESGAFIVTLAMTPDCSELRLIDARSPGCAPRLVQARTPGLHVRLTHVPPYLYRLERRGERACRISRVPESRPDSAGRVVHRGVVDGEITALHAFARHLVVTERRHGVGRLRVLDLDGRGADASPDTGHLVPLPCRLAAIRSEENRDFHSDVVRFGLESFTTPYSVYDYDMAARRLTLRDRFPVTGYDPERYVTERLDVAAADGVRVPLSLLRRRDFAARGAGAVLLYGYGAYGHSLDPEFLSLRLSLLDRGVAYAVAHVRGGGELGKDWHEAGRGLRKETSVTDFLACADALLARGIAAPGRIGAMGESAGGFLVAAAANRRPDLFAAIAVDCPFVDLVGVLSDPALPFTMTDRLEWGDPTREPDLSVLRTLSPLETVRRARYPAILAFCSMNDPRTPYWETLAWAARLRARARAPLDLAVRVRDVGGHQGASDRLEQVRELALINAFFVDRLRGAPVPLPFGSSPGAA
jgi:oligopeptidase B